MAIGSGPADWVPDSCTLPTTEQPLRTAEFDQFFADAVRSVERPDSTRLDLLIDAGSEPRGQDLAIRETACCSFFTFTFEQVGGGSVLHIDVPAGYVDVLDALETRVGGASR